MVTSALIHELRKLQRHVSVVKIGPNFSLSFLWIEDLADIAYQIQRNYVQNLAAKLRRILNDSVTVAEGGVSLRRLLISRRWSCSVTVEYSERKAAQLQRRYRRFFADTSTSSGGRI